ncbi:MAG: ABC transporter ATP-binding protein [Chlorobiales bacterium]|nr:ABC transporter ATP-binding protein [Chlorobiales bacterium]
MDIIIAEKVNKKFQLKQGQNINNNGVASNQIEVLSGFDLKIKKGEFLVLVGPSGSGKSVFLDLVGGLSNPTSGVVYLDDKPVEAPSSKTAYVFQQYALFPWRTALSNIEFGLESRGVLKEERVKIARELLSLFGLSDFEDRFPYQLSGGMQQRVAIARALATKPEVLLMDEPFAALDAQTREILQNELIRIWEGTQTTVIFVTHSIDEAVFLADRVAVVTARPGRIKEIIEIDLPRPRNAELRSSNEFAANRHKVWGALKAEVNKAQQDWKLAPVFTE